MQMSVVKVNIKYIELDNTMIKMYIVSFQPSGRIVKEIMEHCQFKYSETKLGRYSKECKVGQCVVNWDGRMVQSLQVDGKSWSFSNKVRNNKQRTINGNGKKTINVTHWNLGPAHWINKKHTIEAMIFDFKPDIAIINEANIFEENKDHELYIANYKIVLPNTLESQGVCRLAVLVREGVQVKILQEYMNTEIASVWLKVTRKGSKKLHIGAMYRQHHLLRQPIPNNSGGVERQVARWQLFLDQWKRAGEKTECFVIGDLNLDSNKWTNPDNEHKEMTERRKKTADRDTRIPTAGQRRHYILAKHSGFIGGSLLDQWSIEGSFCQECYQGKIRS